MADDLNNNIDLTVRRWIATYDRLAFKYGWAKVKITTDNNRVWRQRYKRAAGFVDGRRKSGGGRNSNYDEDDNAVDVEFVVLDCWPTTSTIGSYLRHPKRGKTQLFRKECTDPDMLEQIFEDPRTHTNIGYHQRANDPQRNSENNIRGDEDRKRTRPTIVESGHDETMKSDDGDDDDSTRLRERGQNKRRRLACNDGQYCRNWSCPYSHSPRCFFGTHCWFQPNCWFDHTHGLCRYGEDCFRDDCWFSHRHPDFYH